MNIFQTAFGTVYEGQLQYTNIRYSYLHLQEIQLHLGGTLIPTRYGYTSLKLIINTIQDVRKYDARTNTSVYR